MTFFAYMIDYRILHFFKAHSCLYSYIPFVILLASNAMLIYSIANRRVKGIENENSRKRQRSMNRTVLLATLLFILMTLPSTIAANMLNLLAKIPRGLQIVVILNAFSLTYHAHGFVILWITNRKFRQLLKETFSISRSQLKNSNISLTK